MFFIRIVFIAIVVLNPILLFTQDSVLCQQLQSRIQPLLSVDPAYGNEDLYFLKKIFEQKKIIAIGEATHGTREFSLLKNRVFRFLVSDLAVRTFALEESFGIGMLVNDFIHGNSKLTAKEVAMNMSLMWRTKEMAEFIDWMKDYNGRASEKEKISFYGIDAYASHYEAERVYAYFSQVDSLFLPKVKERLLPFEAKGYFSGKVSKNEFERNCKNIDSLVSTLVLNKKRYLFSSTEHDWVMTKQVLVTMRQALDIYKSGNQNFFERDPFMESNVAWIDSSGISSGKIMLWAHNIHVSTETKLPNLGSQLKRSYGEKYYSIGFVFNEGLYCGTTTASPPYRISVFSFSPAPEKSFSGILSKLKIDYLFLNFDMPDGSPVLVKWLNDEHEVWEAGYRGFDGFSKFLFKNRNLSQIYDAIFFVNRTKNTQHYGLEIAE